MTERESKIYEVLVLHHAKVKAKHHVVMTVLCGSQNYGLDTADSDYDTYTFVLPTLEDLTMLNYEISSMEEDEYGHINMKDIRLALNLLKRTSPNSVEWFASGYRIIEPEYQDLFETYLTPETLRCNTQNMMHAIGGMSLQLTKRNMPPGKRYSHLLRMECMVDNYYDMRNDLLSLTPAKRTTALAVKTAPALSFVDGWCLNSQKRIQEKIVSYEQVDMSAIEQIGLDNVNRLQTELFRRYLTRCVI